MVRYFSPLKDFPSEETKSEYVTGMMYTIREGNHKLAILVEKWVEEGKVEMVGEGSQIKGS